MKPAYDTAYTLSDITYMETMRLNKLNTDLLAALKLIMPLAEAYLANAPSHPDNAKLETARAAISKAMGQS